VVFAPIADKIGANKPGAAGDEQFSHA
jgi:hypothetical protein